MKLHWSVRVLSIAALVGIGVSACKAKTSTIKPENRGQRGESCRARNDCESGLACINSTCSMNDFPITVEAKQCDIIECSEDQDCCGDRPTELPGKCDDYSLICEQYRFTDCAVDYCDSDADCNGGSCSAGLYCSNTSSSCTADEDCTDMCSGGYCFYSGETCTDDGDCSLGDCTGDPYCDCDNPDYDPADEICDDPDCTDPVCTLKCINERCAQDMSCESDDDCSFSAPICDDGDCVECTDDADCDEDNDEACVHGSCQPPCTYNEECPLFFACKKGECVEAGCNSDRECILAFAGSVADDARLAKCLTSDDDPDVKECKIPCQNDLECAEFQKCHGGYCTFIGCRSDEECRSYFDLADEEATDLRPYVSQAVCR